MFEPDVQQQGVQVAHEGTSSESTRASIEQVLDPAKVGRQLKIWRAELAVTQADVAQSIGVSAQQYQKYESGITPISLSRLFAICTALDRSPSVFLETEPASAASHDADNEEIIVPHRSGASTHPSSTDHGMGQKLDLSYAVSDVVQNFMSINDPGDRAAVMFILRSYAEKSRARS